MCDLTVIGGPFKALEGRLRRHSRRIAASRTHLCHQRSSAEEDIGQRKGSKRPRGILGQPAVAHLAKAPQALDHAKHVFDPGTHPRLVAVLRPSGLIDLTLPANPLIGEVLGLWRLADNQLFLAGVGAVAVDTPLGSMEQIGQRMLVMHIGRCDHRAVRQAALAVHADVQLHAEVPLLALPGLVHLGVARPVGVLGRTGRADDGEPPSGGFFHINSSKVKSRNVKPI